MKAISKFFTSQRFSIRIELRTASKDTPTSAKISFPKRGKPKAPATRTITFTPIDPHDILTDRYSRGSTSDRNSFRYFRGLVRLDNHVRALDGRIRSQSTHRNTDITSKPVPAHRSSHRPQRQPTYPAPPFNRSI